MVLSDEDKIELIDKACDDMVRTAIVCVAVVVILILFAIYTSF